MYRPKVNAINEMKCFFSRGGKTGNRYFPAIRLGGFSYEVLIRPIGKNEMKCFFSRGGKTTHRYFPAIRLGGFSWEVLIRPIRKQKEMFFFRGVNKRHPMRYRGS